MPAPEFLILFIGLTFPRQNAGLPLRTDAAAVAVEETGHGPGRRKHGGALMRVGARVCAGCRWSPRPPSLAACAGTNLGDLRARRAAAASRPQAPPARRSAPARSRVALILPLSAGGNAGVAALSMKNAAEMALAEFKNPNIQLLVKDDGGTPQGAQQAAQQALDEGAEIIIGPLFAQSVGAVGAVARASAACR